MKQVTNDERLGRGVFSETEAIRARRSKPSFKVFLHRPGVIKLSVDRLSVAPLDKATEIADRNAVNRRSTFHGWATVTAKFARQNDRQVCANPVSGNPFHADIILPDNTKEDRKKTESPRN